jgi:pyruvate/2-oxoglutarate dehydrogenase complex dihydrolipoamide dehydrogenase (E3) component
MTTSTLQQLVHLRHQKVGRRAVIVGAEHVSFSAVATLADGGASVAGIVTELPRHQSLAAFRAGAAIRYRVPVWTRTAVSAIHGAERVESVELIDLDSGETREVQCDLVIFTADWIPDHELAVLGEAVLDRATGGPSVDPALRTTRGGVFAAGNLLQGAETADVAALSGSHVAAGVIRYLEGEPWPTARIPIRCEPPLGWISPNALTADPSHTLAPPRGRFLLRSGEALSRAVVELSQDRRQLWRGRLRRIGPGRSTRIAADWTRGVDPLGGPVFARLLAARRTAGAPK